MRIERVEINVGGFVTPPGLRLHAVSIIGGGIEPHHDRVDAAGPIAFRATLGEDDLAAFLNLKSPGGLTGVEVRITPETLNIRATIRKIISIPLEVDCALDVVDGRQLHLRLLDARAFGAGVKNMAESMILKANPVFDAAEVPVTIVLDRVEMGNGSLILFGEAVPPFALGGSDKNLPVR